VTAEGEGLLDFAAGDAEVHEVRGQTP
jgi:hypothetical protein